MLASQNPHVRDQRIVFHEPTHVYEVDGQRYDASVTNVYDFFFPHFDSQKVVDKYYKHWKCNPHSKYYSLIAYLTQVVGLQSDDEIKAQIICLWSSTGKIRSSYGTSVHRLIELYLNNEPLPKETPVEFSQFLEWRSEHPTWVPFRTEWAVFTEEFGIAGQIDSVWKDTETGEFHVVDWKCVEEMRLENQYGECGFNPFSFLANTNFWHYCVQQNLYQYILEKHYGLRVATCSLLQVHQKLPRAVSWKIVDFQSLVPAALTKFREARPLRSTQCGSNQYSQCVKDDVASSPVPPGLHA